MEGRGGMGMQKHRKSGVVHKNKSVAMARSRDYNREVQRKNEMLKARKPKMFGSVRELLGS